MKRIATFRDYLGELTVTYKRTEKFIKKIGSSQDAAEFMRPYFEQCMDHQEEFKVLHLNNSNQVVNIHHVSSGSDVGTVVDVKAVVRNILHINTKSAILIHNHPSGGTKFSQSDIDLTRKIKEACLLFDIVVLDSLIITRETYRSMADEGVI
ncbi:JAB domain-containing protein [Maribacter sp. 4G9]|uniref:JAB domain-containing protein n=1 Tax=Maribacter sp. 4G9 TaxID=1889777 RepID=UPI000C14C2C8|nr:JAB domain-containing protein [Maribacter sp. 4G9]PIB39081.1 hypothetical protein BFP75_00975 [Maribacter sp. 4G9]